MQSLSLSLIRWPPSGYEGRGQKRSFTRSVSDSGNGGGNEPVPPSPRALQHRGSPSHARNNQQLLHDLHALRKSTPPGSPRASPRLGARGAAPQDTPVVGAEYVPPGMLDMNGAMAAVCGSWAMGVGLTSIASVTGTVGHLGDGAKALSSVQFAGGIFNLLCSFIDTGLTIHAWREAQKQYQVFEALLGAQYLMLHQMKDQLRHGPDPQLRAARDLAQFNVDVLSGLLKGFEKAYLLPSERGLALERRQLQLDHLVTADEALRLRQQALAYPDERRQGLADGAEQRRDALQARIDAASQLPLFERMREGLSHPLDLLGNLSDEQIAFLRDGVLQGAKAPFQLFTAIATLLPHLVSSGAAGAALDTVGQAVPPVAVLLAVLNLATANWDRQGGQKRMDKARTGRRAKLRAFEDLLRGLAPDAVDPQADPEQVKQSQRVRRNLMRQLLKPIQRANLAKDVAWARWFRGRANLLNLLLSLAGFIAMAAGTGSYGTIPAAVVSALLGLLLLTQLAKYQGYLAADKQRMHRRDREAKAFDPHGAKAGPLYAGRLDGDASMTDAQRLALQDNTYLSLGWLRTQLYGAGLRASELPLCDAEQALLDAGVPRDTLLMLRQAVLVKTPAQHRRLVDAVVTGALGLRLFPADPNAPPDGGPADDHPPVLRTHAASGPAPFAYVADLDDAVKRAGKRQRRRNNRVKRIASGFWFKPLATPKQAVKALERHERRRDTAALNQLRRDLLEPLLMALPRRPDGLGIQWPERYQNEHGDTDTADCLVAYLNELQGTCWHGQQVLADDPQHKHRRSDRWLSRRLAEHATLAEALKQAVQHERSQEAPWWDELAVDGPPVFRSSDDEAERAEESLDGEGSEESASEGAFCARPLPAYAIKV